MIKDRLDNITHKVLEDFKEGTVDLAQTQRFIKEIERRRCDAYLNEYLKNQNLYRQN